MQAKLISFRLHTAEEEEEEQLVRSQVISFDLLCEMKRGSHDQGRLRTSVSALVLGSPEEGGSVPDEDPVFDPDPLLKIKDESPDLQDPGRVQSSGVFGPAEEEEEEEESVPGTRETDVRHEEAGPTGGQLHICPTSGLKSLTPQPGRRHANFLNALCPTITSITSPQSISPQSTVHPSGLMMQQQIIDHKHSLY